MEDSSAVFLLDTVLSDAVTRECTDVHLACNGTQLRVLFRIQGQLVPYLQSNGTGASLLRRIKALAKLNLAEQRIPQEGTFRWCHQDHDIDIRVSVVPTPIGDSVVLRLLPKNRFRKGLAALGMTRDLALRIERIVATETGLVLVAGVTGSGKTSTLYTLLQQLAQQGRCVVTIEDPVEVPQQEFVQLEVREHLGLTFAAGLKALLRQDPDVIMIGEIRDGETAKIALHAALTGHLVVSTTHASTVIDALARLSEFGISRSLLADVFRAVILQRQTPATQPITQRNLSSLLLNEDAPPLYEVPDSTALTVFNLQEMTDELYDFLTSDKPWSTFRSQVSHGANASLVRAAWGVSQ